jgi:hypothetical protein
LKTSNEETTWGGYYKYGLQKIRYKIVKDIKIAMDRTQRLDFLNTMIGSSGSVNADYFLHLSNYEYQLYRGVDSYLLIKPTVVSTNTRWTAVVAGLS